jgi:hypothetical protein
MSHPRAAEYGNDRILIGAHYAETQTYNLPVVYPKNAGSPEDIGKLAPEAGYLLTVAYPSLSRLVAFVVSRDDKHSLARASEGDTVALC